MNDKLCISFLCKDKDIPHTHKTDYIDSPSILAPWPLRTKWERIKLEPFRQLLQFGWFCSHSKFQLPWKIDCSAFSDGDWECIASIIRWKFAFSKVIGIPRGGLKLQKLLEGYTELGYPTLIVDDASTANNSFIEARKDIEGPVFGVVVFARGPVPNWVWPIFTVNDWAQSRATGLG